MSTNDGADSAASRQGDSKGKGIATEKETHASVEAPATTRPDTGNENKSLAARIAESGAGLTNSILSGRSGVNDLSQYAASSNSKAGPSQRNNHPGQTLGENVLSSSSRPPIPPSTDRTFRSGHVQDHVTQQEVAFSSFLDGVDGLDVASEPAGSSITQAVPRSISERHENALEWRHRQGERPSITGDHHEADVDRQEAQDGAAIVDLLSGFQEEPPTDDPEPPLSETDIAKLREVLFGSHHDEERHTRDWDHALNFIPDFVRPDQNGDHPHASPNRAKAEETYSTLGVTHSPEASRMWVEQWEDVLSRYTDEVWGDLLPLVGTARKELQQLEKTPVTGDKTPNTKALSRLRQILGQIRGV